MPMYAQTIDLVDDPVRIAEYEAHHRRVWPGVVKALREFGITSMHIFRTGTRLFMVYEAPPGFDPSRDYQGYAQCPECRSWDQLMRQYQKPLPGAPAGVWWMPMEEVFDLNTCLDAGAMDDR